MSAGVVISLVALLLSVCVNLIAIGKFVGKIDGLEKLIDFRLLALEQKQDKYNHLQERLAVLERDNKTAFKMLDKLGGLNENRG